MWRSNEAIWSDIKRRTYSSDGYWRILVLLRLASLGVSINRVFFVEFTKHIVNIYPDTPLSSHIYYSPIHPRDYN